LLKAKVSDEENLGKVSLEVDPGKSQSIPNEYTGLKSVLSLKFHENKGAIYIVYKHPCHFILK
jgi:hypothetical protein